jgi:hypothetical protein
VIDRAKERNNTGYCHHRDAFDQVAVPIFRPGGSVPGHILHAECCCGFHRELRPGSAIGADRIVGYTIAYSADGSDLGTEDDAMVNSQQLRTIPDPFIQAGDSLEKIQEQIEKMRVAQGPYLCPHCKAVGLMLHFAGFWD